MRFEWDDEKERQNIEKHKIDFETAAHVFHDVDRLEIYDELHSDEEDRFITIGMIHEIAVVVMVVYTERIGTIRIISARKATRQEMEVYYDNSKRH